MMKPTTAPATLATVLSVLLTAVALLASCTSGDDTADYSVEVSSFSQVLVESAWDGNPAKAMNTLLADCMRHAGFEVEVPAEDRLEAEAASLSRDQAYVNDFGYGVVEQPPEQAPESLQGADPFQTAWTQLSPSEQEAFSRALIGTTDMTIPNAPAPGTCMATISEEVFTPGSSFFQATDLLSEYQQRLSSDERVVAARAGWSACMTGQGYSGYGDSFAVVQELVEALGTNDADREEIRTRELQLARADFTCSSEIQAVTSAVEAELAQEFYDEASLLLAGEQGSS